MHWDGWHLNPSCKELLVLGVGGAWGALPCLARGISALWLEAQKDRTNLLKEAAKVTSSKTSSGSNTRKYVCLTSSRRAPS